MNRKDDQPLNDVSEINLEYLVFVVISLIVVCLSTELVVVQNIYL